MNMQTLELEPVAVALPGQSARLVAPTPFGALRANQIHQAADQCGRDNLAKDDEVGPFVNLVAVACEPGELAYLVTLAAMRPNYRQSTVGGLTGVYDSLRDVMDGLFGD